MPCFNPLKGYRAQVVNPSGKRSIVFNSREGFNDLKVELPCGQCIGCRLERSRQWAIRCVHEAQLHHENSFLTLTYSPEHLPKYGSLHKSHFQKFFKRLRKHFSIKLITSHPLKDIPLLSSLRRVAYGRTFYRPLRYFHCGEYGERNHRPHYHACLFGADFADKQPIERNHNGDLVYESATLAKLWGLGKVAIGDVTFESAAYVARYITKKITGRAAEDHYQAMDPDTGEFVPLQPEYTTMSRRPGIGKAWYDRFKSDVFPHDHVVLRGKMFPAPRFLLSQYERENPEGYAKLKAARQVKAKKGVDDNTPQRLKVKKTVKEHQARKLVRKYEHGT